MNFAIVSGQLNVDLYERPYQHDQIEVSLFRRFSKGFSFLQPSLWKTTLTSPGEAINRQEPAFLLTAQDVLELYAGLKSELTRLGRIRPEPNEIEIQRLRDELADAKGTRDKLLKIVADVHSIEAVRTELKTLKVAYEQTLDQLDKALLAKGRQG